MSLEYKNMSQTDCEKYLSDRVKSLAPSGIRKFFDILSTMQDTISLGVGEPDYATPWHIREAAIDSLEKGYTMYTSNSGMIELRREISAYLKRQYGLEYDPETEILVTNGVSEGLDITARATLNQGDEVIIPDPSYVSYSACISLPGGIPVQVPTYEENNFALDAKDIKKKITPKTKALLFGNPANPTGAIIPYENLIEISELAKKNDLLVFSDEIYSRLIYNTGHTCMATLEGMKERTVLLGGFSKSYAMTGWRIGYAAGNKDIIAAMNKIHQYTIMCAPTMAQYGAIEGLKNGEEAIREMVEDYNQRRQIMVSGFRDIGLSCFEPKGAFYAFPCIRKTGLSSEEFAEKLLIEEKVAVVPGTAFGKCGEGYIRCCYATSLEEIEEALKRIKRFVKKLK